MRSGVLADLDDSGGGWSVCGVGVGGRAEVVVGEESKVWCGLLAV